MISEFFFPLFRPRRRCGDSTTHRWLPPRQALVRESAAYADKEWLARRCEVLHAGYPHSGAEMGQARYPRRWYLPIVTPADKTLLGKPAVAPVRSEAKVRLLARDAQASQAERLPADGCPFCRPIREAARQC